MVRAKFKVTSVKSYEHPTMKQIQLHAVWDDGIPENARFAKATPSGEVTITIDNPPASDVFKPGQMFYLDFTTVEQ